MNRPTPALELGISWILRAGVALSLVLETAGMVLNYVSTGQAYLTFSPQWLVKGGNFFAFVSSVLGSLANGGDAISVTGLGVAVLVLTPYLRVAAAMFYYIIEKDWRYVVITTTVFSIITVGLVVL